MPYATSQLIQQINEGHQPSYIFFWGHDSGSDGQIGPACLSQWYASGFEQAGKIFPTAEHWMMYQKALLFADQTSAEEVLLTSSPQTAKAIGRRVKNFNDVTWRSHAYKVVCEGNKHKFSQPLLRDYLLSTGDNILVEASPYDRIWGIGLSVQDPKAHNPKQWQGTNLLGFALMEVRDELRKDYKSALLSSSHGN
ncbi:MAG: NADAR family protein [Bacteroidota bacterium]